MHNICWLSSTKLLLVQTTTLAYFGGFTNKETSVRQEKNIKTSYWGLISLSQRGQSVKVDWNGKQSQIEPFAGAEAVIIGNEILLSCGTQRKWAVCTNIKPPPKPCHLPLCSAPAGATKWIRYRIIAYVSFINIFCTFDINLDFMHHNTKHYQV